MGKPLVAPTPRVRAVTSMLYFWVYILMGLIIGSLGPSIEEVGTHSCAVVRRTKCVSFLKLLRFLGCAACAARAVPCAGSSLSG